jgi:hypothetical protein
MRPESLCGVLVTAPFCCMAVFAAGLLLRVKRDPPLSDAPGLSIRTASLGRWFLASWSAIGLVAIVPILAFCMCSMRYICDFWAPLALLSIVGSARLHAETGAGTLPRRIVAGSILALALATIGVGILLSVTGYFAHFDRCNPRLLERMRAAAPSIPDRLLPGAAGDVR